MDQVDLEPIITELEQLDLPPTVIQPLVDRLRGEGLTDAVRQAILAAIEEDIRVTQLKHDTLVAAIELNEETVEQIEAVELATAETLKQLVEQAVQDMQQSPATN